MMTLPCACSRVHEPRRVVLTGGPGAGKTAVLELVRRSLCRHVKVLPEAASIIFGGGFPREDDPEGRRAAQRAIYHVQRELEALADAHRPAIVLCDRGTVDGLAYWPGPEAEFWRSFATTASAESSRYETVIHLRTPAGLEGYNHANPVRTESPAEAARIDERLLQAWHHHPRRLVVPSSIDFIDKATRALEILKGELPECCAGHLPRAHPADR